MALLINSHDASRHDFWHLVAAGLVEGYETINVSGINEDISSGTVPETVWPVGGVYDFKPLTAQPATIVSTSTEDNPAGNGIRSVLVTYLDSGFNQIDINVPLNGTTPVALPDITAVNYMVGSDYGSTFQAAGQITVNSGASVVSSIEIGTISTFQVIYTVPNGGYFFVEQFEASVYDNNPTGISIDLRTISIDGIEDDSIPFYLSEGGGALYLDLKPIMIPTGTLLIGQVEQIFGNSAQCSMRMTGTFISNEALGF